MDWPARLKGLRQKPPLQPGSAIRLSTHRAYKNSIFQRKYRGSTQEMSLQSRLTGAGLALGLLVTFSLPALAQQSATTQDEGSQQQQERGGKRWHRGGHGMRGGMHLFRELNLSDAQKQQANAIIERYKESTKEHAGEKR